MENQEEMNREILEARQQEENMQNSNDLFVSEVFLLISKFTEFASLENGS